MSASPNPSSLRVTTTTGLGGIWLLLSALLVTACPAEVTIPAPTKAGPVLVDDSDPRVVRDGKDLYPAKVIERAEQAEPPPTTAGLGSGKPDESNGECRLYAPRLPEPECCKGEYGLDAEFAREQCGLELYLGESFQGTCGYYFHKTGAAPLWLRASFVDGDTVAAATATHDAKMKRVAKNEQFASSPVPGAEGAMWSSNDKLHWAFLPGWDKVRMLSWSSETCSDDAVAKLIAHMLSAKQPAKGSARDGLVPRRRS